MFPAAGDLMTAEEAAAIAEALGTDQIHERLPALRGAAGAITTRVADRYAERRKTYAGALREALAELEAMPEWGLIQEEDRGDIARRFDPAGLPEAAPRAQELASLRLILAREMGLPQLKAGARADVLRRVPPPPEPAPPPAEEASLSLAEMLPPASLTTADEVESWLGTLRTRLLDLLRGHKSVRIMKG
jgi:hypothetical protein